MSRFVECLVRAAVALSALLAARGAAAAEPAAMSTGEAGVPASGDGAPAPSPPPASAARPNAPPPAAEEPTADEPDGLPPPGERGTPLTGPLGTRRDFWKASVGFRVAFLGDRGYDNFAEGDGLGGGRLALSRTLRGWGRWAVAAGVAFDGAGQSAKLRGLSSDLQLSRFTVPLEGRYHFVPLVYGFARVAPGAELMVASVKDPSAPSKLRTAGWSFATDLSVGASLLLGPHGAPLRHKARFWLTPEAGIQLTTSRDLVLDPAPRNDPRPFAGAYLGTFSSTGPFVRLTLDVSL